MTKRINAMREIYTEYEAAAAPFKTAAVCAAGCGYCCTHYGVLDVTTLEGWVIAQWLENRPKKIRRELSKALARNRRRKLQGKAAVCPFLRHNHTCRIYAIRPFSCRQLYSLERCGRQGPVVSQRAVALARQTVMRLQALDWQGYSGHLTYILDLLGPEQHRERYLKGALTPESIPHQGRQYGLRVHRLSAANSSPAPPGQLLDAGEAG
jgi:hypothetical protein